MTRGETNNNPGNIDKGSVPFQGEVPGDDERFRTFSSPVMGIRAIAKLLLVYFNNHGLNTVQGLINRWAPPVENNTSSYVADVAAHVGVTPTDVLDMANLNVIESLVKAIIFHENGEVIYTDLQIRDGVDAAIG